MGKVKIKLKDTLVGFKIAITKEIGPAEGQKRECKMGEYTRRKEKDGVPYRKVVGVDRGGSLPWGEEGGEWGKETLKVKKEEGRKW